MSDYVGHDPQKIAELAKRVEALVSEAQSFHTNLIDPHPIAGLPTDRAANTFRKDLDSKMNGEQIEKYLTEIPDGMRMLADKFAEAARITKDTEQQITDNAREIHQTMIE